MLLIHVLGVPLDGWAALGLAIQFLLPLLVGFVTTKETNRQVQFLLLAGLTLLATVATQTLEAHQAGTAINLVQIVVVAVVNLGVSLLSHYGVWKPTDLAALALAVFRTSAPVTPAPVDPSPAVLPAPVEAALPAPAADLPARHLAVVPNVPDAAPTAGDLPLEPVPAVLAS